MVSDPANAEYFYTDPLGLRAYPLRFMASLFGADSLPVHEQIQTMFRISIAEVVVSIWAGRVPARMAAALEAAADSPALLLRRRYLAADGELMQATCTVHPEDRYVYTMKFRRTAQSQYVAG